MESTMHLEGGQLWQWDTGRSVRVDEPEEGDQVHFARASDPCPYEGALVVETGADGRAGVPASLLRAGCDLRCYLWRAGRTAGSLRLRVSPRPKPDGYVDEPDGVLTFEQVLARADASAERAEEAAQRVEQASLYATRISSGEGAPTGQARAGDQYVDRASGDLYEYGETEDKANG